MIVRFVRWLLARLEAREQARAHVCTPPDSGVGPGDLYECPCGRVYVMTRNAESGRTRPGPEDETPRIGAGHREPPID